MELRIEYLPVESLKPYSRNNKKHDDFDIGEIAKSIDKYGFNDPIGIYGKNIIVEGHGRLLAAKKLGMKTVPCIRLDHMSDKERREYAILHNKTAELAEYDFDNLAAELPDLDFSDFEFDFDIPTINDDSDNNPMDYDARMREFQNRMESGELSDDDEEYQKFVEKFKPKVAKTTDDCYTPPEAYEAVADYVSEHYRVSKDNFVRPFVPGGDYRSEKYRPSDIVVDNPPFSILAEILDYYNEHGIKYFLFAPHLTVIGTAANRCSILLCGATITYENGAVVNTSFVTNLDDCAFRSCPTLYKRIQQAMKKLVEEKKRDIAKYIYPPYVMTATMVGDYSRLGIDFEVPQSACKMTRQLDSQKESGKALFGSGYLISDRKVAEREKAEREKAEREKAEREKAEREKAEREKAIVWELSEREKAIIRQLE